MSLEDVIDITDGDNDLIIEGNAGDTVQLNSSEWSLGGHEVDDDQSYDVYDATDDSGASLEIDTDINVQFDE